MLFMIFDSITKKQYYMLMRERGKKKTNRLLKQQLPQFLYSLHYFLALHSPLIGWLAFLPDFSWTDGDHGAQIQVYCLFPRRSLEICDVSPDTARLPVQVK